MYVPLAVNSRPEGGLTYIRKILVTVNKITRIPVNWNNSPMYH